MTPRQLTEDEINDVFRAQLVAAPVSPDQEPLFV